MVHFKVPIYCGLCSKLYSKFWKKWVHIRKKRFCLISPEGISTEQTGIVTSFKADNTSANGGLAFPLKLKPNIASTINL